MPSLKIVNVIVSEKGGILNPGKLIKDGKVSISNYIEDVIFNHRPRPVAVEDGSIHGY